LTGLLLILFLVASWSIGIVMDLSPTFVTGEIEAVSPTFDLRPILIALMVIATVAFLIRGRTPAFVVAVFFLPAIIIGTYLFFYIGFGWSNLMIVLMVIISALAIWKGFQDERMSPYLAGVLLIGVLFFGVMFVGGGGEMIQEEIAGNGEGVSIPWDDPGGYIETAFGGFGTFILILLVGGIIAFLLVQRVIPIIKSSPGKTEEEKVLEDQLSSTMDRAVTELREGKDVHSTILRCYQRMCLILEQKGAKNFEFMTPREFERQAIKTLDVPASKISEIREIFELAKYSGHQLGEEERNKAVKALKQLRIELE